MTSRSPEARRGALTGRGVMVYLRAMGELHAECEPVFADAVDAARPMFRRHRTEL